MVQAYNFLAGWQLFPEKCDFQYGVVPKSGNCKIESIRDGNGLKIINSWVSPMNEAFSTELEIFPDGNVYPYDQEETTDSIQATISEQSTFEIIFLRSTEKVLEMSYEILPNGYMKTTRQGKNPDGTHFINKEIYHKQMSILPYASSVSGVAIRPTNEGMIRHKALSAMEEQTNMQLDQIRQQIELLARQAQEINKRKELSLLIYDAKLGFKPQIGHTYHLYQKRDDSYMLSMLSPKEWGGSGPFKEFISTVKMLADHTWVEIN